MMTTDKHMLLEWAGQQTGTPIAASSASALGLVDDTVRVAVFYNNYHWPSIDAHIVSDGSRKWMNKTFLRAMFDYPFNELKCSRITAPVKATNMEARKFVEKLGFVAEGTLRGYYSDGIDRILYGLLKKECRYV